MMSDNTGGPAFPGLHPSAECRYNDQGMTLRDYFAAKAMQAIAGDHSYNNQNWPSNLTIIAYKIADAMLAAREGK